MAGFNARISASRSLESSDLVVIAGRCPEPISEFVHKPQRAGIHARVIPDSDHRGQLQVGILVRCLLDKPYHLTASTY